jgi:hypothetical protein
MIQRGVLSARAVETSRVEKRRALRAVFDNYQRTRNCLMTARASLALSCGFRKNTFLIFLPFHGSDNTFAQTSARERLSTLSFVHGMDKRSARAI